MPLAIYTSAAWKENGGIEPAAGATVEVRSESTDELAALFEDRDGEVSLDNPFSADGQGRFTFFVAGGAYRVKVTDGEDEHTLRYQAVGTAAERDIGTGDDEVPTNSLLDTAAYTPAVRRPEITSPDDGAEGVSLSLDVEGTPYAPLYSVDERDYREVQAIKSGGDWDTPDVSEVADADTITLSLETDTDYELRMRDVLKDGTESDWSEIISVKTADVYVEAPSIQSPEEGEEDVGEQPVVEGDAFSVMNGEDEHVNTRLRFEDADGNEVYSEEAGEPTTSMSPSADVLEEGQQYTAFLAYEGEEWGWSDEGSVTFTTADSFFPEITDQDSEGIGEPVAGGYAVSEREDILGEKYGLVISGGDGDSWQREVDSDGIPVSDGGAGGDGQMHWSSNEVELSGDLSSIDDSHGGYDEGNVVPNRSDLESRWGDDFESYFPSSTDGLFNTEVILAYIESNGLDWTDWPAFNFIRHLRQEPLEGHDDWYIPAQATEDNFEGDGTLGDVTDPNESEMADIFWLLLQGYAVDLSEGGDPEDDIPSDLYKFFYERPDDGTQGSEAFDAYDYWASSESGTDAYSLRMYDGGQNTLSKDSTSCVRACRRVYL